MPHAVIEYSENVAGEIISGDILHLVHGIMTKCGLFSPDSIKTRVYEAKNFMVGSKDSNGSFVHVSIAILPGRTSEQKQALSTSVIDALRKPLQNIDQVTVEIRELDKETYRKK
jgi:5-carboxymethyl-2-hydroxymuconate isomerase